MKKVLYLLLICTLFASCSSDDDKDETKYLDNKIIEGSWYWMKNGDSTVYIFKDNFTTRKIYDKYSQKEKQSFNMGSYKITTDRLIIGNATNGKYYKLDADSLFIQEGVNDDLIKYIRVKE